MEKRIKCCEIFIYKRRQPSCNCKLWDPLNEPRNRPPREIFFTSGKICENICRGTWKYLLGMKMWRCERLQYTSPLSFSPPFTYTRLNRLTNLLLSNVISSDWAQWLLPNDPPLYSQYFAKRCAIFRASQAINEGIYGWITSERWLSPVEAFLKLIWFWFKIDDGWKHEQR